MGRESTPIFLKDREAGLMPTILIPIFLVLYFGLLPLVPKLILIVNIEHQRFLQVKGDGETSVVRNGGR